MNPKQVEAMAQVLASYELFDWNSLPENSVTESRDREAFRIIAAAMLDAAHGGSQ